MRVKNQALESRFGHFWYNVNPVLALASTYPPGGNVVGTRLFATPFDVSRHSLVVAPVNLRLDNFDANAGGNTTGLRVRLALVMTDASALNSAWAQLYNVTTVVNQEANIWNSKLLYCRAPFDQVFEDVIVNTSCIGIRLELEWNPAPGGLFIGTIRAQIDALSQVFFFYGSVDTVKQVI